MAEKVTRTIVDDIDGSEGAQTVAFGWNHKQYEIDLSDKNKEKLEKALRPFVDAARPAPSLKRGEPRSGARRTDLASIRSWAKENGLEVSERGRVSAKVLAAYEAAQ